MSVSIHSIFVSNGALTVKSIRIENVNCGREGKAATQFIEHANIHMPEGDMK